MQSTQAGSFKAAKLFKHRWYQSTLDVSIACLCLYIDTEFISEYTMCEQYIRYAPAGNGFKWTAATVSAWQVTRRQLSATPMLAVFSVQVADAPLVSKQMIVHVYDVETTCVVQAPSSVQRTAVHALKSSSRCCQSL